MSPFEALTTPDACAYAGVSHSTLRRKATPAAFVRNGRRGRPAALWAVRDLDRIRAERQGGGRHV